MPWFKVDDGFAFNAKAVRAGDALALWVRAGAWCAQQLTDGFVPDDMIRQLGRDKHAAALVRVGLWERIDDPAGYQFHDWSDYQPTSDSVRNERAANAERARKARAARKNAQATGHRHGVTHPHATDVSHGYPSLSLSHPYPGPGHPLALSPPPGESPRDAAPVDNCPPLDLETAHGARLVLAVVCPEHGTPKSARGVCSGCEADRLAEGLAG